MARHHAQLLTSIWSDPDWLGLSPGAQRVYMLLLSQGRLSLVGHLDMLPHRWAAFSPATTIETITEDLLELEAARFVAVDHDTQEILIRTFVRHDITANQFNRNLAKGLWTAWAGILSPTLRQIAVVNMPDVVWERSGDSVPPTAVSMRTPPRLEPDKHHRLEPDDNSRSEPGAVPRSEPPPPPPPPATGQPPPSSSERDPRALPAEPTNEDDDDQSAGDRDHQRIETTLAVLADRDLTARQTAPGLPPLGDVDAWTRQAIASRRDRHGLALAHLAVEHPRLTPTELANRLEPPRTDATADGDRQSWALGTGHMTGSAPLPDPDPAVVPDWDDLRERTRRPNVIHDTLASIHDGLEAQRKDTPDAPD